jgi:hypothetical protein
MAKPSFEQDTRVKDASARQTRNRRAVQAAESALSQRQILTPSSFRSALVFIPEPRTMLALRLPSAAYMVLTRSYYVVKNSAGPEAKALQCDSQPRIFPRKMAEK